jgi:hypothetical protein
MTSDEIGRSVGQQLDLLVGTTVGQAGHDGEQEPYRDQQQVRFDQPYQDKKG